ncbi:MAG: AsmA family protein, partial [Hyphomicrobium sp.]
VPYFVDWNGYRGIFEEEATRILGREVRVGGNVNVRFLPSPYVSFEKLRIADPSGATGEPFFSADSFTMRLSAPPLLKGIIEANEIVLEKPFVRLAVDAEGEGNWRSLSIAPGALPFVPAGVTLQSVKINDGTIAFHGPKGIGFAEIGGLNGELKADSVEGPFSFKGIANWADGARDVRIATGATEADGGIRFKATVRGASGNSNVYAIDGRLDDVRGRPRIDGELTAKLLLASDGLALAAQESSPSGGKAETPLIDFKARVAGDSRGLRVDDINLSFEHVGQPQLIAGSATATWADKLNVELALSSRWLDLDRVARSQPEGADPVSTARSFILAMMEALPKDADSRVDFDLDQATLGGEAVSGIKLEVARNQGTLRLSNLRAGLPGGTRLSLDGAVAGDATNGQTFRGDITLHGSSLARFLDWTAKDKAIAEAVRSEGPFSLQGQLAMTEHGIDLTGAGAEIAGRPVTGELHYSKKDRPRLAVALDGAEIDAGQLWPSGVAAFKQLLAGGNETGEPATSTKLAWLDPAVTDLHLRLRTGELITGRGRLRDVDMDIGIDQGRLAVRSCNFVTTDQLQVELEGDVADTLKSPRGALQWVVAAPTKEAYATLVQLFELSEDAQRQADALGALVPMRLAGTVDLGKRQPQSADVAIDGTVQGAGRLIATALLDGGLDHWHAGTADITATIDSPDVAAALRGLNARASSPPAGEVSQSGEVFIKSVGIPAKGMMATATVKTPALAIGYDGRIALDDDGARKVNGELRIAARGLADVMAVAGLGGSPSLQDTPFVGKLMVASADRAVELKPQGLMLGGSKVDGSVALSYPSEGPAIVTGEIQVDAATIPGLLGLVLDRKQAAEVPVTEPLTSGKSIWPEHGFDFASLTGVEGKLSVVFGTLTLTDKMAMKKARAEIDLAPGKVTVTKLEGAVLGGAAVANLQLEQAPGGAALKAELHIDDMHVGDKAQRASLQLTVSGRASTPGGLISVAAGKGELQLGDISVHAPTPLAVVMTSDSVLSGDAGGTGEQLATALRERIGSGQVKLGPRTIPIEIVDGAAKLAVVTLPSDAGTTKVETTVDLASLIVDSAWVVAPRGPDTPQPAKPGHGALPSVGFVYTGPLANFGSLEQRITTEPLERELAIRKMELDADQLERLHKADADRARRDDERRQALESDEGSTLPEQPEPPHEQAPVVGTPLSATDPGAGVNGANIGIGETGTAPAIPPSSASAAGVAVPAAPGQEGETFGAAQVGAPVPGVPTEAGSIAPPTATSTTSNRPRRPQRQVQPNEQVLRNLMNNAN